MNFITALLLGGPSHASAQGPSTVNILAMPLEATGMPTPSTSSNQTKLNELVLLQIYVCYA